MTYSESAEAAEPAGATAKRTGKRGGKRERLAAAAAQVLHEQGMEKTTIADIARAADVPLGNVYYYFKTKDQLVEAAIDAHAQTLAGIISALDELPTPQARLKALLAGWVEQRELTARYGCPTGSLASELDKRDDGLDQTLATVMRVLLDWAEQQFLALGRSADARELAVALIASYQGISLLTNTFRDPELMASEGRRLERWIDSLT
ncbi:TetR/AcrR family transcriptional regulator [Streptomyces sp. ZAF1911]|uniref:TetR/AcrR family transcriptional regulator n=1 Tax=unclassified Streptomyces TaxID=2593676 RepID=UPI00237B6CFE|nr:TetR/AcrR family transcriptional regulator [Streptomyces sp. ZAF1911]MDD9377202.1 TetR/AcrR family transcriptional regulator [Streptomyces sp. ZAF1911]